MKKSIFNAVQRTRYLALLVLLIFTCGNARGVTYTKITSTAGLPSDGNSAKYLIVYESLNYVYDGSKTGIDLGASGDYKTAGNSTFSRSSSVITIKGTDNFYFTISRSGNNYIIQSASGYYIGRTSNSNGINQSTSTTYNHTITFSSNNAQITSSGGPKLQFLNNSGSYTFKYYSSSQQLVQLYKEDATTTYTVTYNLNGGTGTTPTESAKASGASFTLHNGTTGITAPAGKAFSKWKDQDDNLYNGGTSFTMPAKNVTLTAQWSCITPTISAHPSNGTCVQGGSPSPLTVTASGGTLSYQWKQCATADGTYVNVTGGSGGTTASYTPPVTSIGTMYYKCVVTNTGSSCGTTATSNYASFEVTPVLTSISVQTAPTKTAYVEGETFDPTGLVITRTYSNSTSDTYTYADHTGEFSFSPTTATALTTSNTVVTITYGGQTVNQSINVYAVTLQVLDDAGNAIRGANPGMPTRSGAGISPAANADNYVWWHWTITGAELGSAAATKSNTITNPTASVVVTAVYYAPRTVTWKVNGVEWTPYTTSGEGTDGTSEVARNTKWNALTLPTNPTTSDACGDKFIGWTPSAINGKLDKDDDAAAISTLISTNLLNAENKASKTSEGILNNTTFHAVFADHAE